MGKNVIAKALLVILSVPIILFSVYKAEGVHFPLLLGTASAIGIGFLEPKKGWLLALIQAITLLVVGYLGITWLMGEKGMTELQMQCLISAVGITFAGSFLGAFIKRAIDS